MMEQIRGIVLPAPTVFLEDGRVDEKLMRELTDWFVDCGVHAFSFWVHKGKVRR